MKKVLLTLAAALLVAVGLTGCKDKPDLGTAPVLNEIKILAYDTNINNAENAPALHDIIARTSDPTTEQDTDNCYAFVALFSDPDKDVEKIVVTIGSDSVNYIIGKQIYENQISMWRGFYIKDTQSGNIDIKAYAVDAKGNKSSTLTYKLNYTVPLS